MRCLNDIHFYFCFIYIFPKFMAFTWRIIISSSPFFFNKVLNFSYTSHCSFCHDYETHISKYFVHILSDSNNFFDPLISFRYGSNCFAKFPNKVEKKISSSTFSSGRRIFFCSNFFLVVLHKTLENHKHP